VPDRHLSRSQIGQERRYGERRQALRPLPSVVRTASTMVLKPPTPEPMTVAARSCCSTLG
jgi:hypothetical protein